MSHGPAAGLAALIEALVRTHRAAAPPPRGVPYLGLEHASGTGFHLLDALAARGIFRKYEVVLELGAGLGGTARWLAVRLGCEVVGTTADPAEAAGGNELTRRAGLAAQVSVVPAVASALPFRSSHFTHVWMVESIARMPDAPAALAEAWRALRRGGTLAVQELVSDGASPPELRGWHPVGIAERIAQLRQAGFVELETRDRSDEAPERSAQVVAARARFLARLRADPRHVPIAAERQALMAGLASGALRVFQIVGRKP
jgi:SAM-dependent methyltransferase